MKKYIILALLLAAVVGFAQDQTKLFRNVLSSDKLKTAVIILNGDTIKSSAPSEGDTFIFSGGKYINSVLPALSADSMTFESSTGILRVWRNGFAITNANLDGRYLLMSSADTAYMRKRIYDQANVAEQLVGLTATQTLTHKTLTRPTISDFTNAQHDHSSVDKGGLIDHFQRTINLPANSTVAGRVAGAVAGTDYPTGWTLSASEGVNLVISHNLTGHKIAHIDVYEVDNGVERLARPFSDAFAGVTTTGNTVTIEGLDTIELPLRIEISFK